MYKVELSSEAQRFYNRCARGEEARSIFFEALEADPRAGNNVKPLRASLPGPFATAWVTFVSSTIQDRSVTEYVITSAKRSDVYD